MSILIAFHFLYAQDQNRILDSLFNILKNARHDSIRYYVYMGLGNYFKKLNPDTDLYYYLLAEKISDKIPGDKEELKKGDAIRMVGWCNYLKGNLTDALNLYEQSLKIAEKFIETKKHDIKNRALKLKSIPFSNIGVIK